MEHFGNSSQPFGHSTWDTGATRERYTSMTHHVSHTYILSYDHCNAILSYGTNILAYDLFTYFPLLLLTCINLTDGDIRVVWPHPQAKINVHHLSFTNVFVNTITTYCDSNIHYPILSSLSSTDIKRAHTDLGASVCLCVWDFLYHPSQNDSSKFDWTCCECNLEQSDELYRW